MDVKNIEQRISELSEINAPELQNELSVSYSEIKALLDKLVEDGRIEFLSGVTYKVLPKVKSLNTYEPKDEVEKRFIDVLWRCLDCDRISVSIVQRKTGTGYATAARAVDWMEQNGFISRFPYREIQITKKEFIEKFGDPNIRDYTPPDGFKDKFGGSGVFDDIFGNADKYRKNDDDEEEDDFEEEENSWNDEEDEDDEDDEDDEENADFSTNIKTDDSFDVKEGLSECIKFGLRKKTGEDKYILGYNKDEKFEIYFTNEGRFLKISDGGQTCCDKLDKMRKIKNLIKDYAPVAIDDNRELYIEIESPIESLTAMLKLYAAIDAVNRIK